MNNFLPLNLKINGKIEIMINELVRGTRIILGDEAKERRKLLNSLIEIAESNGFNEIILPTLEKSEIYTNKAG